MDSASRPLLRRPELATDARSATDQEPAQSLAVTAVRGYDGDADRFALERRFTLSDDSQVRPE